MFTITVPGQTTFDLVKSLQPDVTSWPVSSMVILRNTRLDQRELVYYDALLYLGPPGMMSVSRLSPQLRSDEEYVQMRTKRLAALGQRAIDRLRFWREQGAHMQSQACTARGLIDRTINNSTRLSTFCRARPVEAHVRSFR